MKRKELTHTQWKRLKPLLPPQQPKTGRPALNHRRIISGILWILRTGAPWRDLPKRFGCWSTVASRFYRWQKAGIWQPLFEAVQQQADAEGRLHWDVHYIDGTIVRAHQHAAGSPRGAEAEAFCRSQGGLSTQVHLRAADEKHLITFVLTPGQRHEALGFEPLMAGGSVKRCGRGRPKHRPGRIVGDKAYSSRHIRAYLRRHGIRITIPHKVNEHRSGPFDRALYRMREQVERLSNRLKQNRRLATRYEKCAANYRAMWLIAATLLWLEH
jgi:transposase